LGETTAIVIATIALERATS